MAPAAGVNPVVVLSAALLLELNGDRASDATITPSDSAGDSASPPGRREVLSQARLDEPIIATITALLDDFRNRRNEQSAEILVLRDALALADMTADDRPADAQVLENQLRDRLRSEAARAWARSLFAP